ncbi:glycosyltransferase family 4 protein, partial [Bacillus cereus]
ILFLGNMYHEPNRIALDIIISTIMPEVLKKISNSRLLLVGDAPEIIKKRVEDIKYISYYGKVLDLNQVFSETSIAICPVTTGSGLRIKVLDYLAAGLPIITTSLGLPEVDLKNALIIEDNINSFSKHIINILK